MNDPLPILLVLDRVRLVIPSPSPSPSPSLDLRSACSIEDEELYGIVLDLALGRLADTMSASWSWSWSWVGSRAFVNPVSLVLMAIVPVSAMLIVIGVDENENVEEVMGINQLPHNSSIDHQMPYPNPSPSTWT